MNFLTLIKAVPRTEDLRFDPDRRTMVREGPGLVASAFDLRALQTAVDLRRPDERVMVVSMGPPAAESVLRESLIRGADRAVLVSDPRLAGSDSLATALVLAQVVARLEPDVVFAGRCSTDSETGQLGAQLAGLLQRPILSSARRVARLDGRHELEVDVDTETGWARTRVTPPVVITTDEKIVKLRKLTDRDSAKPLSIMVEHWGLEELPLKSSSVGLPGSPTIVTDLHREVPSRRPTVLDSGNLLDRVQRAVLLIRDRKPARPRVGAIRPPLVDSADPGYGIATLVTGIDGNLSQEALAILAELSRRLAPAWPMAIFLGPLPGLNDLEAVASNGARTATSISLETERLQSGPLPAAALAAVIRRSANLRCLALASNLRNREIAGGLSARLGLGLVGDAVGVRRDPTGDIVWEKPSFGGEVLASVVCRTRPSLATVRVGMCEAGGWGSHPIPLEEVQLPAIDDPTPTNWIDQGEDPDAGTGDLESARTLLVVGMGLGGPERLPEIHRCADRLVAAVGATRRVVDAGWLPRHRQVGLTGRALAPDLAILVGVSGSANHLIGVRRARTVLAVNSDHRAPVFEHADVGIVGPWEEVLPALTDELSTSSNRPAAATPTA